MPDFAKRHAPTPMFIRTKKKQACFLPKIFAPRGVNELIRLGSDHDGGYVVSTDAVASTRFLLSFGLGHNCDFEWDVVQMGRLAKMHCYDPSVTPEGLRRTYFRSLLKFFGKKAKHRAFRTFYRQYKSLFSSGRTDFVHVVKPAGIREGQVPLNEAMAALQPEKGTVFLKIDIEGAEYDILDQVIENNEFLSGLAIEFHGVPAHLREIEVFMMAMREFMFIDNTTPNNYGGVDEAGIPHVIEVSMSAREQLLPHIPIAGATTKYRMLNAANDPSRTDLEIVYTD